MPVGDRCRDGHALRSLVARPRLARRKVLERPAHDLVAGDAELVLLVVLDQATRDSVAVGNELAALLIDVGRARIDVRLAWARIALRTRAHRRRAAETE